VGTAHAPAQQGQCLHCHSAHMSSRPELLNRPANQLCFSCHDLTPQELAIYHGGIAPGAESCLTCHDSHGGPDRSLTFPVKHEPFAQKDCAACHKEVAP
jgi:predicted CXXCH cytochrome family protein